MRVSSFLFGGSWGIYKSTGDTRSATLDKKEGDDIPKYFGVREPPS